MKKTKTASPSKESLRAIPEVDFSRLQRGRRGAFAHLLTGKAVHAVVIDDDIWQHFGDSRSINAALRMLVDLAKNKVDKTRLRPRRRKAA